MYVPSLCPPKERTNIDALINIEKQSEQPHLSKNITHTKALKGQPKHRDT